MKALCESSPQAGCHFTRLDQVEQLVRASDRVTADNFRRKVLRELVKIKTAWPDLNYSTAKGVLILWPSAHDRSLPWNSPESSVPEPSSPA